MRDPKSNQRGEYHSICRLSGWGIKMTADFLWKTMQATRQWHSLFKVLKEICQPRIQKQVKNNF